MRGREPSSSTCFYEILGVDASATPEEIRRAYRRLAVRYHPDKNPNGREMFEQISRAYETLSDEELRAAYDGRRVGGRGSSDARGRDFDENFFRDRARFRDPFEMFRDVFGDDFAFPSAFGGSGIDPFRGAGGVFGRRRSFFDDDDFFGGGSSFGGGLSFGGGFGGGGFGGGASHATTWSSSTTTTTTISSDGTRVTRTVSRRVLPDGTVVESQNVSQDESGRAGNSHSLADGGGGSRFLDHHHRW